MIHLLITESFFNNRPNTGQDTGFSWELRVICYFFVKLWNLLGTWYFKWPTFEKWGWAFFFKNHWTEFIIWANKSKDTIKEGGALGQLLMQDNKFLRGNSIWTTSFGVIGSFTLCFFHCFFWLKFIFIFVIGSLFWWNWGVLLSLVVTTLQIT